MTYEEIEKLTFPWPFDPTCGKRFYAKIDDWYVFQRGRSVVYLQYVDGYVADIRYYGDTGIMFNGEDLCEIAARFTK